MTDTVPDQSFIIVKYGDGEEALFNPWCTSHTLMEWIRRKCRCDDDIIIDLVDLEGQVKNLSGRSKEYANEVVNGRETYILIRVERCHDGKFLYTSLLNNLEEYNSDLMVKLNSMSRPQTRTKKNNKKTPSKSSKSRNESPMKRPGSGEKKKR
ncbi:uncharacterized protein CXorf65 homolog [Mytilus edulis]|uniref:uncharacterized protein CXorf65 homolog n=1 Tax=Mytilus edulis TaxID=6550 RepID=UPI0039EEF20D